MRIRLGPSSGNSGPLSVGVRIWITGFGCVAGNFVDYGFHGKYVVVTWILELLVLIGVIKSAVASSHRVTPAMPGRNVMKLGEFESKLAAAVNHCSRENASNTPDFILAMFMERCLRASEEMINRREEWYGNNKQDKLTASEAVYGVLVWLSTRKESLKVGAEHECSSLVSLAKEFCEANHLQPLREQWADNLIHPS